LIELGMVLLTEPTFRCWSTDPRHPARCMSICRCRGRFDAAPSRRCPRIRHGRLDPGWRIDRAGLAQRRLRGFDAPEDDPVFMEARLLLVRAVRAQAPLAGALTLLKLRRARNRADLAELLDEVEARISRPHRSLATTHTMRRVRQMLGGRADSALETA
jgi:hypothetical protein